MFKTGVAGGDLLRVLFCLVTGAGGCRTSNDTLRGLQSVDDHSTIENVWQDAREQSGSLGFEVLRPENRR